MPIESGSGSPRLSTRARYLAEYALYRGITAGLRGLPEGGRRRLAGALGTAAFHLDRRHRKVAFSNLELAMPEVASETRELWVRSAYRNLARTTLETIATAEVGREAFRQRFEVEGLEHLESAEAAGRGVLLMTAHLGNWEAAGQCLALLGKPLTALARPLDNPRIERHARRFRERFGNRSVAKRKSTRRILETLREGGRVALLIDQRVHPNEGKAYRFFGHPAYTSPLLASVSLKTGAPVVPFYGIPEPDGPGCRLVLRPAMAPDADGPDAVDLMTLRYLEAVEAEIRRRPELWLWMHRRWRKNPTTIFKERIPDTAAGPEGNYVVERSADGDGIVRTRLPSPTRER